LLALIRREKWAKSSLHLLDQPFASEAVKLRRDKAVKKTGID
jgi:hypothetical protein